MDQNMTGLSLDLIIHPGCTIKEVIDDRGMNQEELAIRTGFSAKHVSEVINGKKDISTRFAYALEIALGIPSSFWLNLQNQYDNKMICFENQNNISSEEYKVLNEIKEILNYFDKNNIVKVSDNKTDNVLIMRKFFGLTNLTNISNLSFRNIAYRTSKSKLNPYALYAWQKLCEFYVDKEEVDAEFDKFKLIENIPNIKKTMFMDVNSMVKELKKIFASCGVSFVLVKHFTGAPVQGYIQKRKNKLSLCMTIRQLYADIFWFTLFHEIGHILNDDYEDGSFDYEDENSDIENRADLFARNALISEDEYMAFLNSGKYKTISAIKEFSDKQEVIPSITIGRLNRELNDYSFMSKYKVRYKWIEE